MTGTALNVVSFLFLGFFLGMRHATDADHVVAVSTIVSQARTARAAAPIGILWGLGHTLTILLVGGAIILFGIVIPARVGLGMELSVAMMLVVLGGLNVRGVVRDVRVRSVRSVRPVIIGVVHGLAGSAAVALLVLGTIREPAWALGYLVVFGAGTIAGMLLITTALAFPIAAAAQRFDHFNRTLCAVTGLASIAFGAVLFYEIGFVQGLFTGSPQWSPH
jgi:high-affinity nickel-transport protein